MKTCPSCSSQVAVLILNLATQKYFCHFCAETTCPSFKPETVYSRSDVAMLRSMGVSTPGFDKIEEYIEALATCDYCAEKILPSTCGEAEYWIMPSGKICCSQAQCMTLAAQRPN